MNQIMFFEDEVAVGEFLESPDIVTIDLIEPEEGWKLTYHIVE
jgi:hypothetical protein